MYTKTSINLFLNIKNSMSENINEISVQEVSQKEYIYINIFCIRKIDGTFETKAYEISHALVDICTPYIMQWETLIWNKLVKFKNPLLEIIK